MFNFQYLVLAQEEHQERCYKTDDATYTHIR